MRIANSRRAHRTTGLLAAVLALAVPAAGVLPEPDHIFYGTPTRDGEPVLTGVVSARLAGATEAIASYALGSRPEVGNRYVLRIPIDSVDPRQPGHARTGDAVQFFLDGVPSGNGTVGERGTVQLLNVDPAQGGLPTLAIADLALYEGNAGATPFAFTVTLSEAIAEDVTFTWSTSPGTAQGGIDFVEVPAGTPATIPAGDTTTTLTVIVNGDTFEEDNETFFVNLANVSANAVLFDPQAVGTILDDDRPPAISIADLAVIEGDSGSSVATLSLSLTRPIAQAITVGWATSNGTATAGSDYQAGSGVAVFPPNSISTTIPVTIFGDLDDEDDETFFVTLSGPSSPAVIADGQAVVTILDDDGFLSFVEAEDLSVLESLFGATGVVVSPDGLHVYAVGQFDDSIAGFSRSSVSGELTYLFHLRDGDAQGPVNIDGLDGAESVAISPDGAHVYVAAFNDASVALFERDAVTGGLTYVALWRDSSLGGTADGLLGAISVILSPDGSHVYVAGSSEDAIAMFDRDDDDSSPTYGQLTYLGKVVDGAGPIDGLDGVQSLRLAPSGAHLYAASAVDKAVAVFARDAGTGLLTFVQVRKDGFDGVNGLDGASSVAVSPDGLSVYVTGPNEDAVAVFSRNDVTGALTFLEMEVDGNAGVDGLDGAIFVTVSHDGRYVYVAGFFDDAVAVFQRDTATGLLSYLEIQRNNFGAVTGLARPIEIGLSGDDQHLYVPAQNSDKLVVFMRDAIAPSVPTVLVSTSHTPLVFSNDPTVDIQWSGAEDNPGGSGLDGYSFLFDASPLTAPDFIVDLPHTSDPHSITSPPLPDGTSFYFHFRVCDRVGNCSAPQHLGPFYIDTTPPVNPAVLISTTHPVPGGDVIGMSWTPATDALSGVDGYSVFFDNFPTSACDQTKDLEEDAVSASSPVLGDGTWYFHLCTLDNAGNWSTTKHAGPYIVEVQPPRVVGLTTVADTGDGVLLPDESTDYPITQFVVAFNEPVSDPPGDTGVTDASNPANYPLLKPGPDGIFQTTICGPPQGDDQIQLAASATYDAASFTTVLRLGTPLALPMGSYRLLVCGSTVPGESSIVDLAGKALDGDGNGIGGDPLVLPFEVVSSDLLRNPNFDADLSSWIRVPPTPGVVRHDGEDVDDAPTSGSMLAEFVAGTPFYAVSQCVAVDEGASYELGGVARIDNAGASAPLAYGQVQFFASTNCSVTPIGVEQFSDVVDGDTGGAWEAFGSTPLVAPVGARSAYVSFVFETAGASDFDGYFDRLQFQAPLVIFGSGFESGDFSGWDVVVGGI